MRSFLLSLGVLMSALPAVASTAACPFKASELQAAIGPQFAEGKELPAYGTSDIKATACRYEAKSMSVRVNTNSYRTAADAQKFGLMMAGRLRAVPGDADKASFQEGQGDMTDPSLWYVRQNVVVEIRMMGSGWYKDNSAKELPAAQQKLLKLRRVP